MIAALLTQAPTGAAAGVSVGEAIAFWILGPLCLLGALGMIFSRNAVHSALWLVLTMLSLGALYMIQSAPFLGFTQIIVYTGAIMMLFLFVLMLVGRESSDSVVEVLRGQRLAATVLGIGMAALLATGIYRAMENVTPATPLDSATPAGGGPKGLGKLIFTDYLFPFELTSALLITAAIGAMVLAFTDRHAKGGKRTQKELVVARFRGEHDRPSPLPGPGVFATANSVATPALLPDGSVAPESLSAIIESTSAIELAKERKLVADDVEHPDAHALVGSEGASEGSEGEKA
ncbi:NADH-quinone oxidoreductase subunit J [Amycolatopsis sp. SID8362]|uniref:NADH-quinone oxidoreductase subunit J n=1 Tax=Amycolatopsis sp. SID8362 TaxID=2690346 RepID=UPI001367D6CD|nr:NADH-quinone oxidoreductase subunit J [Amycolatopsis sp. SID8362]NBH11846.1 NADH-quinone oxidoreductase subunit J [Amycolatopsis sp. SID8362]NED48537.1 NADH-quinone oxidoreductase subunit J [Amycolatopsis sp. SID8362]